MSGPAHGTLTLNANGSFTYTPAANYNGRDSFTYRANDGTLNSNVATVSLTVTAVNDAPVAAANSYSTPEEMALNVTAASGVLGNDTDVDGDSLTAVLVSGPAPRHAHPERQRLVHLHAGRRVQRPRQLHLPGAGLRRRPLQRGHRVAHGDAADPQHQQRVGQRGRPPPATPFTFTVTLSSPTSRTITVNYATANGTATAGLPLLGGDYTLRERHADLHGRTDQQDGHRDGQRRSASSSPTRPSSSTCPTRATPARRRPGPGHHPQRRRLPARRRRKRAPARSGSALTPRGAGPDRHRGRRPLGGRGHGRSRWPP